MSKYANTFMRLLKENDLDLERQAMESSLDDGTDPSQFDTNMDLSPEQQAETDEVADAMSKRNQEIVAELQQWIDTVETFLRFLNSEDPDSVQSRLAAAIPDTVMDKMKQSQQTKIARVAADLASLHQGFLGFMSQTKNSKFRYVVWALSGSLAALSMFGEQLSNFC
jgi:hypothetical protein